VEETQAMSKSKKKIPYNGRDENIVKIIKGATKSGIHKDLKKEENKYASRSKVKAEDDCCLQCGFPYREHRGLDANELAAMECGFCSVSCMDYYKTQE
jgi:hypothetical protein